jgi:hypothetical protein
MRRTQCLFVLFATLAGLARSAVASENPASGTAEELMAAMDRTPNWGHPDLAAEFSGVHHYQAGHYAAAMAEFTKAARYADKLSQLCIGLMYLNGQGVQKDPVAAFAWVAIAAERQYPQFVATRDRIWATLHTSQREQAKALAAQLSGEYGDAVAMPRMAKVLRRYRAGLTGSMLGFGTESVSSMTMGQFIAQSSAEASLGMEPFPACGAPTIDGAPATGCGNLYAAWRWDPKLYFKARDATWIGTVTVGPLQQASDPANADRSPVRRTRDDEHR